MTVADCSPDDAMLMLVDHEPPSHAFGFGRDMSPVLSVEECVAFAEEMIRVCDEQHSSCKPSGITQFPRRVLDLGVGDGQGMIRLTEYAADHGSYITLSHCWGKTHSMVTTTSSNYQQRIKGIPETTLPRTFLDAVHIA